MNLFYAPELTGDEYRFNEEESKHIIRVLRFGRGDIVFLTNGKGDFCQSEIVEDHVKSCLVKIIQVQHEFGKRNYRLHMAIAPTKNSDRFEWFMEKATEIGIDEITPVICDHSERRVQKTDRLHKVIITAMKQSMSAYLPKLNEAMTFRDFISLPFSGERYMCSVDAPASHLLKKKYSAGKNVLLLIGPEGDFSKEEVDFAVKNQFEPISLGERRLRTETAGIVACTAISILNQ